MSAHTEIDRLSAARPAVLRQTEDIVDAAAQDRILAQILSSGERAAPPVRVPSPVSTRQRARRLITTVPGAAALGLGVAAVLAAVALAVTALVPGGSPASPHAHVQLTAWTVNKLADGNVHVRIFELKDAAALQRKLRSEGVPASVTNVGDHAGCRRYPASSAQLNRAFPGSYRLRPPPDGITIDPSALPKGTGVQLAGTFYPRSGYVAAPILVYASQRCTGT